MQELNRGPLRWHPPREHLASRAPAAFAALVWGTTIVPIPSGAAERPSFDCAKAIAATERAICGSDALALLDRNIAALYRQRRARVPSKQSFEAEQRQWLAVRDACGADPACLEKELKQRQADLQERIDRFAKAPAKDESGFSGAYSNDYGMVEIEAVTSTEFDVLISTRRRRADGSATFPPPAI
jgi:uncharacterized protein